MTSDERATRVLQGLSQRPYPGSRTWDEAASAIAAAVREAEAAMRERCARVAESTSTEDTYTGHHIAAAIRKLK